MLAGYCAPPKHPITSQYVYRSCRIGEAENLFTLWLQRLSFRSWYLFPILPKHQDLFRRTMAEEQEPFLPLKERIKDADTANLLSSSDKRWVPRKEWRIPVIMHGLLLLIYTIVSFAIIHAYRKDTVFHPCQ